MNVAMKQNETSLRLLLQLAIVLRHNCTTEAELYDVRLFALNFIINV